MKNENNDPLNLQIHKILDNEIFTTKFISGIAGDKTLTLTEKKIYHQLLDLPGNEFYVKALFFLTHHTFEKDEAKNLWQEILAHKDVLTIKLERNVEITVATLDYLTNIKDRLINPTLVGEAFIGKIAQLASIDNLTTLYNRYYFTIKINEEIMRYKRYKTSFSLIMLDIDNFKLINDKYGHQIGDEVLIKLASILLAVTRKLDICTRFGGEEFAIILPHTASNEAEIIAERIRKKIELKFLKNYGLTVSLGVSTFPESGQTLKALIKGTDEALYESKANGKNRVTFMGSRPS